MSCSNSPSIRKSAHAAIRFYALVAAGCVFLAVVLAFILPFITGFIPLFSDRYDFSLLIGYGTQEDGSMSRILKITAFTIAQALISAFLATGVGLAAAFFCANRNFRMRSIVLALSSVPLCVPAVIIALGFILFFGTNGIFNTLIRFLFRIDRPIITSLFSLKGIILIHAFYNFPLAMKTITHMWERLGWEAEQAAELLGANRFRIFTTITLPALFHPVAASFLLIFLFCFFSFIIILLFGSLGVTTLEVELYKTARASLNMHFCSKNCPDRTDNGRNGDHILCRSSEKICRTKRRKTATGTDSAARESGKTVLCFHYDTYPILSHCAVECNFFAFALQRTSFIAFQ